MHLVITSWYLNYQRLQFVRFTTSIYPTSILIKLEILYQFGAYAKCNVSKLPILFWKVSNIFFIQPKSSEESNYYILYSPVRYTCIHKAPIYSPTIFFPLCLLFHLNHLAIIKAWASSVSIVFGKLLSSKVECFFVPIVQSRVKLRLTSQT